MSVQVNFKVLDSQEVVLVHIGFRSKTYESEYDSVASYGINIFLPTVLAIETEVSLKTETLSDIPDDLELITSIQYYQNDVSIPFNSDDLSLQDDLTIFEKRENVLAKIVNHDFRNRLNYPVAEGFYLIRIRFHRKMFYVENEITHFYERGNTSVILRSHVCILFYFILYVSYLNFIFYICILSLIFYFQKPIMSIRPPNKSPVGTSAAKVGIRVEDPQQPKTPDLDSAKEASVPEKSEGDLPSDTSSLEDVESSSDIPCAQPVS